MAKKVSVTLSPERVSLGPGETAEFVASVHNTSEVVEAYTIDVQGIDPAWSKLSVTSLSLFPGDKEIVRIQVTPPISSSAKAGSYPVSVRVISKRDPAIGTIASFILDLGKVCDYDLALLPKKATGRKGPFQLAITNNGNTVSTYKLEAFDPEGICDFRFKSDTVAVDPGTTKKTPVVVNPKKKPFTGAPRLFSFSVKAAPLEGDPEEVEGELECRALLPKWALAGIAVGVVALIALAVMLVTRGDNLPNGIDASLRQLAPGQFRVYEFKVSNQGTKNITASWVNKNLRFSVVLIGPDGKEYARQDGSSPLQILYAVPEDNSQYGRWAVYVANASDKDSGSVQVTVK